MQKMKGAAAEFLACKRVAVTGVSRVRRRATGPMWSISASETVVTKCSR